jgi:hypothetical protein
MENTQYKIVDWASNRIFPNKIFDTFLDAWDYLLQKFPSDRQTLKAMVFDS